MRVLDNGSYIVYVYSEIGQPHHLPHCHVHWAKGDTVVALPTLTVLAGPPLPRDGRRFLLEGVEEICACWDRLNSEVN